MKEVDWHRKPVDEESWEMWWLLDFDDGQKHVQTTLFVKLLLQLNICRSTWWCRWRTGGRESSPGSWRGRGRGRMTSPSDRPGPRSPGGRPSSWCGPPGCRACPWCRWSQRCLCSWPPPSPAWSSPWRDPNSSLLVGSETMISAKHSLTSYYIKVDTCLCVCLKVSCSSKLNSIFCIKYIRRNFDFVCWKLVPHFHY